MFSSFCNTGENEKDGDTEGEGRNEGDLPFHNSHSESQCIMRLKPRYQSMHYAVQDGEKTPLHLLTIHVLYTMFVNLGADYFSKSHWDLPIPSNFSPDSFTIAAFENVDHADNSSQSGIKSNHWYSHVTISNTASTTVVKTTKICVKIQNQLPDF